SPFPPRSMTNLLPAPTLAPAPAPDSRWHAAPARTRITYQPRADHVSTSRPDGPTCDVVHDMARDAARDALPRALTLLTADERARFDLAVRGVCAPTHLDSPAALGAALGARPADGVVVSAAVLAAGGGRALPAIAALGRTFAATPLVVLVTGEVAPAVLVGLGRSGARAVVDVRSATGWGALQGLWPSVGVRTLAHRAADVLAEPLADTSPTMRRFVLGLFEAPAHVRTVQRYAARFGVLPTTLTSRFFRAGLPAPRQYLALARLARAAQLLESPRWTVGAVAAELEHSSAQAFSRHLVLQLGVRPREFRRRYDTAGMLERFAAELLAPYAAVLRTFEPF
ncbi:MAG TPA: helix-turn-helix domain-containing protein, partial [Gemmatirosa sp.]